MELLFSKINGTNSELNYEEFKNSIVSELAHDCDEVEVLILNNFPAPVLTQATLDFVLFIKVPLNQSKKPKICTENNFVYLSNLIIAVSVVKEYKTLDIKIENDLISTDNAFIEISENASKLKWGLTNYLADACGLKNNITVHPIFWVLNDKRVQVSENTIIANSLTFSLIKECIALNSYLKYPGYIDWNYTNSYDLSIRNIFSQASKDSVNGYLTKQKIERFQNKFDEASQKAFDFIGKQLVIVKGKAGTGKSSDLLKWMLRKSLAGNRATFLTYNTLLVFDLTRQIKSFENQLSEAKLSLKGTTTAYTIHQFMFNLAKKLGVMLLMSDSRINELSASQDFRYDQITLYFDQIRLKKPNVSIKELKVKIQNERDLNQGLKKEALDFLKHNEYLLELPDQLTVARLASIYKKIKIEKVKETVNSNVFLKDYHKVLEEIYKALTNTESFFKDFAIEDKYELLETSLKLKPEKILLKDGSGKINIIELKKRYEKSINSVSFSRTLYVDEAQDCHPLERDIFFSIFGNKNIVISSGGKEQLIRYPNLCDWNVSKGSKVESHTYPKKRKSFRMKPAVAALANHIAKSFNIDLKIEPLDTNDHGSVKINISKHKKYEDQIKTIGHLLKFGERQGCTAYESLIILKNAKENSSFSDDEIAFGEKVTDVTIDENDIIKLKKISRRTEWELINQADKKIKEVRFWNATGNVDKKKQSVPGSLSVRGIYYESCRGLEAWSLICFDIDTFFESKRDEDEAENFLLNDIFDVLDSEKRKDMYAATWVLMAITRAMDTCYLDISNLENTLSKVILDFAEKHPHFVEIT